MTTLLVAFEAQPGMSTEAFREYYREEHAPIVAALPHLESYSVTFPADTERAPFDGVARLEFPDREAFGAAMESDAAAQMQADTEAFIADGSLVQLVGTTESLPTD